MQIIKLTFTLLLLMLAAPSHSAIFSKITKSTSSGGDSTYYYVISSWDYADATPNPCFGLPVCYVGISHRHTLSGRNGATVTVWSSKGVPCVSSSATIGELGKCVAAFPSNIKGSSTSGTAGVRLVTPYSGMTGHIGNSVIQECVGIFWATSTMTEDNNVGTLLPGSVCGIAPPPAGACGMPDAIMLDHGSLAADDVQDHVAQQQISIDCNKSIDGRLYLQGGVSNGKLPLGGGITSTIALNGSTLTDAGMLIPLKVGANPLMITSTLSTSGKITTGEHTGQGVLILTLN